MSQAHEIKSRFLEVIRRNPGMSAMPSRLRAKAGFTLQEVSYNQTSLAISQLKEENQIREVNGRYYLTGSEINSTIRHPESCICKGCLTSRRRDDN